MLELPSSEIASVRGRKACTIWIFGPTSSGKTTIANALLKMMRDLGEKAILY
jgi:adenylylsulfate kinase-like enzyme